MMKTSIQSNFCAQIGFFPNVPSNKVRTNIILFPQALQNQLTHDIHFYTRVINTPSTNVSRYDTFFSMVKVKGQFLYLWES